MNTKSLAIVAALLSMSTASLAQQSQSTTEDKSQGQTSVKASDAAQGVEKPKEDIDQEITNPRMRAESGAKKKYSMQFNVNYSGGNFASPFGKKRPDITNGQIFQNSMISAGISARYRLNKSDSIGANVGLSWVTPFRSMPGNDASGDKKSDGEISNPSVDYSKTFAIGKLQNNVGVSVSKFTSRFTSELMNYNWGYDLSYTALGNPVSAIPLTVGLALTYSENFFNGYPKSFPAALRDNEDMFPQQVKSDVGIYPFAEYNLSDKLALRTVFRPWIYSQFRKNSKTEFERGPYTQSFGLSVSLTRDVYLYPNFQFQPKPFNEGGIIAKDTNVGLNAIINL